MRILITGSRDWDDYRAITDEIGRVVREYLLEGGRNVTVVHGGAAGADSIAGEIAEQLGATVEVHPAKWETHTDQCPDWHWTLRKCKMAGHRRNQEMVDLGADVCLAFIKNDSRGATSCADRALKAGIPVLYTVRNI